MKKATIYAILATMMVSMFVVVPTANVAAVDAPQEFLYGVGSLLVDLDPAQSWDSASNDVIEQVCEGLFAYNLTDPDLAVVPRLVTNMGTWSTDATEFTVTLKSGVKFHDGSDLDGNDVKYSFDRLNNLCKIGESQLAELYEPLAGVYPDTPLVIKSVNVSTTDPLTVTFYLNYPYVAFVPLLCYTGSFILPEDKYPVDSLMDVASDILVGTGPFKYISQTAELTTLEAFADYHRGAPQLDKIYFILYSDATAKNQAFLAGDIDWLDGANPEFLATFEADPDITVGDRRPNTIIQYMGMNNKQINKTMRQAISYAINYDYIISEVLKGNAVRMTSVVPAGILYHVDCDVATYNVTKAREILVTAGLSKGLAVDDPVTDWQQLSYSNPIATYNYSYNTGNSVRQDLGTLVKNSLYQVGIKVNVVGMAWGEYLTRLLGEFDKLQLYMIGWAPDYNDPSNYVNPLLSNTSHSNGAQVNDPTLQAWMAEALELTNTTERAAKYAQIQEYVAEDLMPWVFLSTGLGQGVSRNNVKGIVRNAMGKLDFYPMYFDPASTRPVWTYTPTATETTEPTDTAPTGIPGYSLYALMGLAAFTVSALIFKKRK
jgi:peptide/nickel transport system substrate-binding protein